MARRRKWTRDRILATIRELHEQGEKLTVENMHRIGYGGLVGAAYKDRTLGSWKKTLAAAGLDPSVVCRRKRKWTSRRVLDCIRQLAAKDEDLSHRSARQRHQYLVVAAVEFFGSWEKAITAAGLDYASIRKQESWTREKILKEIRELHARGEDLSYGSVLANYSSLTAAASNPRYFGSWGAAVAAAGIDYSKVRKHRPPWSRERIIQTIRELHARGEDLVSTNIRRLGLRTMEHAARKSANFGSWRGAVEAAGIDFDEAVREARRRRRMRVRREAADQAERPRRRTASGE